MMALLALSFNANAVNIGFNAANMSLEVKDLVLDCVQKYNKASCNKLVDHNMLPSAKECDADICSIIGDVYRNVDNNETARQYYKKACELKDGDSCMRLGEVYLFGEAKNYAQAKTSFEKACELKDAYGCFGLGIMYANGHGVRKNAAKADRYFLQGCELDAGICLKLGEGYKNGDGFERNFAQAVKYYKKACELKDKYACFKLGNMYGKGEGVKQNKTIAKEYMHKACDLGHNDACGIYRWLDENWWMTN